MRCRVIIAKGDEWPHFQRAAAARAAQLVFHHGGVLARDHEDALLELQVLYVIRDDRKWIESKFLHVLVALRMNRPAVEEADDFVAKLALDGDPILRMRCVEIDDANLHSVVFSEK